MSKSYSDISAYRASLSGDISKRYDEKISIIQVDPYTLGKNDFQSSDRNSWPSVTNMDIIQFFVFRNSSYTEQQLRNYKSLDAYRYFQDGWVQEILHKKVNGAHLIKAKVCHSMRVKEKPLEPWVIFNTNGFIESAHCTCMAGLGECCSHIGSVLFAMETSTKIRDEASVTDVPAYWLFPGGANFDKPFKRIRDMDLQSAAKKRKESPKVDREREYFQNVPSPTKNEEKMFFEQLSRALPKSAILSLTDKFSENFIPKAAHGQAPQALNMLLDKSVNANTDYDEVLQKCELLNLKVTKEQASFIEKSTLKQADSTMWYKQRCGRVTASTFYSVCHTKLEKPSVSLLKKITNDKKARISAPAIDWGKKHERHARNLYEQEIRCKHTNLTITDSGLQIHEQYPQFAASPDGLIECDCCGKGCIEVKCPITLRDQQNLEALDWINSKRLCKQHTYYYQVQMQLFVTDRDYCDFIVWWPNGIFIERIEKDVAFWAENSAKALTFHKKCVLPELLCNYFTSKSVLTPRTVPDSDSTAATYCICNGEEDGRKMIMCEKENCEKVWFHLDCIKMKRVPKGKWYCNECKKSKTKLSRH